jgi:hypothetical protein
MSQPMDDSDKPLEQRVPPPTLASPSDLRPRDPNDMRWYRPDLPETLQLMGWRLLLFAPAVGLIALLVLLPWHAYMGNIFVLWWKLIVPAVVLPGAYAISVATHAIRERKEPFCIHCGYDLTGLPDGHNCPECGEPFSLKVIDEYRRDPNWFIERFKKRHDIPVRDAPFEARVSSKKKSRDGT